MTALRGQFTKKQASGTSGVINGLTSLEGAHHITFTAIIGDLWVSFAPGYTSIDALTQADLGGGTVPSHEQYMVRQGTTHSFLAPDEGSVVVASGAASADSVFSVDFLPAGS